jgi:hypothetical protein
VLLGGFFYGPLHDFRDFLNALMGGFHGRLRGRGCFEASMGLVNYEWWICGAAAVAVLLRASRLRRDKVTSNWWRVDIGVPELDGIQHSKLLIQNFAARAECAFPRDQGVF